MSDLIRRSDALNALSRGEGCGNICSRMIRNIPAVDAVEVVQGHWITAEEALAKGDYSLTYTCSVCGHCDWDCTESESFNYCPHCGARMDGHRREDGDTP